MILLLLGLASFAGLHLFTTVFDSLRDDVVARIGERPWKLIIAVGLVLSVWLMVRGYGDAPASMLWSAPGWARTGVVFAMLPVLILYMGSFPGSAIRAHVRHPQLTGFALWAGLHLLVNGEIRATVLFGGLLLWAVVQIVLLNRRDGVPPLPAAHDSALRAWMAAPVGVVVWALLLWGHEWLFGVSPLA